MSEINYPPVFTLNTDYGQPYIVAKFSVGNTPFAIVFNEILTQTVMHSKQYHIHLPPFCFPLNGMIEIFFDMLDKQGFINFGAFQHLTPSGVNPVTFLKVAGLIRLHYTARKPGGYLFYAARSSVNRVSDLKVVYDRLLGFGAKRNRQFARRYIPAGWQVYNGICRDGRGYVIIC